MRSLFPICRDGEPVPRALQGAVAAIGNFDGVHRGHQALIAVAQREAQSRGAPHAALTFEPHPRLYFKPNEPLFRLTPETVKLQVLKAYGLGGVFLRRFDTSLASLSARDFVSALLARDLQVSGVVVGHDFHFGRGREGNADLLRDLCAGHGITCTVVPPVRDEAGPISSSRIRAALQAGDILGANALLGHRWFVEAEVRHGDKRGRTLGYPTANMRLPEDCRLRHGIYAVRARLEGTIHGGVASFGRRPTFDNGAPLLETFLFDFMGDLYGKALAVEFLAFLRGEERFESVDALVAQMDRDSVKAREVLAKDEVRSLL